MFHNLCVVCVVSASSWITPGLSLFDTDGGLVVELEAHRVLSTLYGVTGNLIGSSSRRIESVSA